MDAGHRFLILLMAFIAIWQMIKQFAASNSQEIEVVKKQAESKAIDVINRLLK